MPFFNCDAIVAHETSTHIRGYQGLRDSGANFGGVSDRGQPLAPVLTQVKIVAQQAQAVL